MQNGHDPRGNLTNTQFLIWLGQRLNPDAPLYNMIVTFDFEGALDVDVFDRAFRSVVNGSDALRTVVEDRDGLPHQRILPHVDGDTATIDLSAATDPAREAREWIDRQRLCPFDLDRRLFESALLKLSETRHIWYLSQHHLITDGWSFLVIYRRVAEAYAFAISNREQVGRPDYPQYADYAQHERAFRTTSDFARSDAYWADKTKDASAPLEFFGKTNPQTTARTERVVCELGGERSVALRRIAREKGFAALSLDLALQNIFATLTGAFVRRATGSDRFRVGVPFHNRPTPAWKATAGVFIEICPLRFEVRTGDTFAALHKRVTAEMFGAMRHAQPGVSSAERNRAYEVLLNFVNVGFPPMGDLSPKVDWVHPGHGDREHALRLQIHDFEGSGSYRFLFDFNTGVFDERQRGWAVRHFLRVVDAFLADREARIDAVSLQSDDERAQLVQAFNETGVPYPADQTVVSLFETQAARTPDAIAVVCDSGRLTYTALSEQSNRLAHQLVAASVGAEQPVAIRMEHSLEAVVSILAVLKAGAAYVPIDPAYPGERLAFMLEDIATGTSATPLLLTQSHLTAGAPPNAGVIVVEPNGLASGTYPSTPIDRSSSHHLAYIIYTSGSTGKPKGVMVEHRSLTNYIWWARAQYSRDEALAWPLFSSLSFDLTVTSIFTPLVSGGRIVAYRDDPAMRGMNILRVVEDNQCDIVKLTPSHLAMLRNSDMSASRIRKFIVGGEDFKTELAAEITKAFTPSSRVNSLSPSDSRSGGAGVIIFNEYGPTEATVGCMIHRFGPAHDRAASVPIGTPAANARVYVLDAHLQPVPTGVVGEMVVAGDGLARGYFSRPELTRERFIEIDPGNDGRLPFVGRRLYKTGDLARWAPDGRLEFLGRADHQVKIGGARLELGEIEARLRTHPAVKASAVVVVKPTAPQPEPSARQHCTRCGLESNFPGVSYDAHGVCNFCRSYDGYKDKAAAYFRTMRDFEPIVAQIKQRPVPNPAVKERGVADSSPFQEELGRGYDCIVLLSGGKDSTYMLYQLVGFGLRPLAFTLDNGFISAEAKANIRRVVNALGVDHVFGSTPAMNAIFVDSLKTYANVCNGCFKTIYTLAVNLARERGIRFIVTGLSRGQFFETRLSEAVFTAPNLSPEAIDRAILEARKAYHRRDDAISRSLDVDVFRDDSTFDDIQFIDFYRYCTVSLDEMYAFLREHAPWVRPADTGRSTNCLINDAGIWLHKRKRGYHNYALPYAWDVRLGHKTRAAALDELNDEIDEGRVRAMLREIGYDEPIDAEAPAPRLAAYVVSDPPITPQELRVFLSQVLPSYMVPSFFIQLDRLPLSPNGKVDHKALPSPYDGPSDRDTRFVAPRTAVERALADIWAEALRVEKVGIHDNFFESGGDSIINIQIVAKANQAGLTLTPSQLFRHQTIAELAAAATTSAQTTRAPQGPVTGPVPLTPVQLWFFQQGFAEAHHWNQVMQLHVQPHVTQAQLESALRKLMKHHDMLRAQFIHTPEGWTQTIAAQITDDPLMTLDLSTHLPQEAARLFGEAVGALHNRLDLERGVLMKALLADFGGDRSRRLVIAVHHLAVDGVSWWVLLNDLDALCEPVPCALPAKTTSFQQWAEGLARYADTRATRHLRYWARQMRAPMVDVPLDEAAHDSATVGHAQPQSQNCALTVQLDPAETHALLHDASSAAGVRVEDVLLAALAHTLSEWTGRSGTIVLVEGHGREDILQGVDITRTVGWFTSLYPVTLTAGPSIEATYNDIKHMMRAVPNRGVDYGVLRYMSNDGAANDFAQHTPPRVLFNYLGQVDTLASDLRHFTLAESLQLSRSPAARRPFVLEVNARVTGETLEVSWTYDAHLHRATTVETLAHNHVNHVRQLLADWVGSKAGMAAARTATGATVAAAEISQEISQAELSDIFAEFAE